MRPENSGGFIFGLGSFPFTNYMYVQMYEKWITRIQQQQNYVRVGNSNELKMWVEGEFAFLLSLGKYVS